jgi:Outer membrane protein/protective antigen OMA87
LRFRLHLPVLVLFVPLGLAAQTRADSVPADSARADSARAADRSAGSDTLRAVQLDRRDIFDPDEHGWVARLGNALHVQTRAATIRRELLFKPGEPFDSARAAESERNLRGLGVFRRVRIDTVRTDSGLVARVLTKDGWSTKADWRFRSTGGEVAFTIGLVEDNLLGTASSAAVRYKKTPDRSTVTLAFRRPRLFAGDVGLSAVYEDRSDGRLSGLALEQPFYSLTSPRGFRIEGEDRDERVLQFFDGARTARDTLTHRFSLARASAAWALRASSEGYLRLGVQGQVRREDFLPEGSAAPFPKTVTGAAGPYITWSRADFLVTRGYAGFAREEDVDLGLTVRFGVLAAPKAFGYERDGLAPQLAGRLGLRGPGGFGYLEALAGGLYDRSGLDSGSVQLAATAVVQPGPHQVGILHLEGGWLDHPLPGAEFDLGLGLGTARLPEPRVHRRPLVLRHRRIPGHRRGRLPGHDRAGHRRVRGPRRGVVRRLAPAHRLGRGRGSPPRRQPLHRHRCPPIRFGAPVRERCRAAGLGGDGGERVRVRAARTAPVIIGRPQPRFP